MHQSFHHHHYHHMGGAGGSMNYMQGGQKNGNSTPDKISPERMPISNHQADQNSASHSKLKLPSKFNVNSVCPGTGCINHNISPQNNYKLARAAQGPSESKSSSSVMKLQPIQNEPTDNRSSFLGRPVN
jgi:hypothetical protein